MRACQGQDRSREAPWLEANPLGSNGRGLEVT